MGRGAYDVQHNSHHGWSCACTAPWLITSKTEPRKSLPYSPASDPEDWQQANVEPARRMDHGEGADSQTPSLPLHHPTQPRPKITTFSTDKVERLKPYHAANDTHVDAYRAPDNPYLDAYHAADDEDDGDFISEASAAEDDSDYVDFKASCPRTPRHRRPLGRDPQAKPDAPQQTSLLQISLQALELGCGMRHIYLGFAERQSRGRGFRGSEE
ncbi:hypothetical protein M011DRAFT_476480 [Sporormia fimetaria CBS 119925]|uniref:Uncharacterized protein n=1 Tax=Sporormia fimetaria CBS 119925 TaxID=1340428 RepID=A0A6A6VFI0_9PLEO|nr:hypothetical protein M011DRAFT_476480 [Sporormia fimetaria CBS 119925]